jgi:hypothetical protein
MNERRIISRKISNIININAYCEFIAKIIFDNYLFLYEAIIVSKLVNAHKIKIKNV